MWDSLNSYIKMVIKDKQDWKPFQSQDDAKEITWLTATKNLRSLANGWKCTKFVDMLRYIGYFSSWDLEDQTLDQTAKQPMNNS